MNRVQIDRSFHQMEMCLTKWSAYSIIVPGILKIGLGLLQLTVASIATVSFGLAACDQTSRSLCLYSWEHVQHGAGNILAGVVESIPLVASIAYIFRLVGRKTFRPHRDTLPSVYKYKVMKDPSHKLKWMPYERIVAYDTNVYVKGEFGEAYVSDVNKKYKPVERSIFRDKVDPSTATNETEIAKNLEQMIFGMNYPLRGGLPSGRIETPLAEFQRKPSRWHAQE